MSLISIIIPVYNVEDYLEEAVISVCNQTYKKLEIILVDDGSTDNSSKICDELSLNDCRIKVIHKNNGGLSSARNAGLEIATGDYIGFVDSDDYIVQDMFENLLNAFKQDKNVGITSGQVYKYINGRISPYNKKWEHNDINIIQPNEFARQMLLTYSNFTCWSKLYRRDIIQNIHFREGRNNEDSYFMFDLSKEIEINNIYTIEIPYYVYYYRIRENSICNSTKTPLEIDIIKNFSDFRNYYEDINNKLSEEINQYILYRLYHFFHKILKNHTYIDKYFNHYITLLKSEYSKEIYNNKFLSFNQKIRLVLMSKSPHMYRKLYSFCKRI